LHLHRIMYVCHFCFSFDLIWDHRGQANE
jgi:hypothetical protein